MLKSLDDIGNFYDGNFECCANLWMKTVIVDDIYDILYTSSMSCVFLHNNLKTTSVTITLMNCKDTCGNRVLPHASTGMSPRIPNLEFMSAPQFCKLAI